MKVSNTMIMKERKAYSISNLHVPCIYMMFILDHMCFKCQGSMTSPQARDGRLTIPLWVFFCFLSRFTKRPSPLCRHEWKCAASHQHWAAAGLCHTLSKCQQALAQQVHECQTQRDLYHAVCEAAQPRNLPYSNFRQAQTTPF